MTPAPVLILLTGPPGVGKSTLTAGLASRLGLPALSRDTLKELLFDTLGTNDRDTSRRYGQASFRILAHLIDELLRGGVGLIVDSNLTAGRVADSIVESARTRGARVLHLRLTAPAELILARYEARAKSGERHPGHFDLGNIEELRKRLESEPYPHPVLGACALDLDTSQADPVGEAIAWVENQLRS